jgi:hypothetical protein
MVPVTISGVGVVDAVSVIDGLVKANAELQLQNAALRSLVGYWESLAVANVVEGAPEPDRASNGHTGPDPDGPGRIVDDIGHEYMGGPI